ncbi:Protein-tyrosine sulfotransferase 2 [Fukomys damarensis]|uniref:Protein-tyrosine sulfotransferase n=1 Tax=Fukomys damarensis TaxID=885580 RepID=A0A091DLA9_FUKDA|nr:Protein-tyrosine sulfotransferase 2 [Fukomys damarensis]
MRPEEEELVMLGTNHVEYRYGKAMPLIFVGGVPRSGTTLMRAMLDAHPEVRCGEETRIIPRVLAMRQAWSKSGKEKLRLDEAGVTDEVMDSAMQAFILEVIAKHGEPARVLCNKDPFTLKSSVYLSRLFPNSKFLLMVRDGRASVHSMITRKVTIAGFDLSSYRDCLTKWNKAIEVMYAQCMEVGKDKCLPVYYEQLVLHPRRSLQVILDFLGIAWSDAVLHHEDLIGKPGGVSLSKIERSTDQVIKPVNLEALSKWTSHIPGDVVRDMAQIAPMLARLGYDPYANPPNYGNPDPFVINNTRRLVYRGAAGRALLLGVRTRSGTSVSRELSSPLIDSVSLHHACKLGWGRALLACEPEQHLFPHRKLVISRYACHLTSEPRHHLPKCLSLRILPREKCGPRCLHVAFLPRREEATFRWKSGL